MALLTSLTLDIAAAEKVVILDYTNHEGKRNTRRVVPLGPIEFKKVEPYHKEPQWLMSVFDIDKMAIRSYAMKDIHSWNKELLNE